MNDVEHNYRLLQEIEHNRRFLLQMYAQNPALLKTVEPHIRNLLKPLGEPEANATIRRQSGISLIELIMFIVIVSVALAGLLLVMNVTTKGSADPLMHKQALAIAESLLEEVELMPFTYCDPDDANATTASGTGDCAKIDAPGPEATFGAQANDETRHGPSFFDNVNDYHNYNSAADGGIKDITGDAAVAALSGYSATVTVAEQALDGIVAADSLLITVTVTAPNGTPMTVEGMRTRYAPRATP